MLSVKAFHQSQPYSCGPASLRMVLDYFGIHADEDTLTKQCRTTPYGTKASHMAATARKYGLDARVKDDATLADIAFWVRRKKTPVIVAWFLVNEGHYSVVQNITDHTITLLDPFTGRLRRMRTDTFLRVWFDYPGAYPKRTKDIVLRRMIIIRPRS